MDVAAGTAGARYKLTAVCCAADSGSPRVGGVLFSCFGSSIANISNARAPEMGALFSGTPSAISNAPVAP
jgi:hypothetical protein